MLTWYEDDPTVKHDVPETRSDQRMHIIGADCWCNPQLDSGVYHHQAAA